MPLAYRAGFVFARNRALKFAVGAIVTLLVGGPVVWLVGVRDTPTMFDSGVAQHALALIKQRSSPAMLVRKIEITPTVFAAWTRDPQKKAWRYASHGGRTAGPRHDFEYSSEQVWHFSRQALLFGGLRWDHLPEPDPVFDGVEAFGRPTPLDPADLPDLTRLAQTAVARAGLPGKAAVALIAFNETLVWNWREQHSQLDSIRRWTVRVETAELMVDIDFDPQGKLVTTRPSQPTAQ